MNAKDKDVLDRAEGILHREGFSGVYDGDQAKIFWEAASSISKAVALAEVTAASLANFKSKQRRQRKVATSQQEDSK